MSESVNTCHYLSADEFFVCCAAAGIEDPLCFDTGDTPRPTQQTMANALFSLQSRGLMTSKGSSFTLGRELSDCFRLIRDSAAVVCVRGAGSKEPCCLAYGNENEFVTVVPGGRSGDYAGVTLYADGDDWISGVGLTVPESVTDEFPRPDSPAAVPEELVGTLAGTDGAEKEPDNLLWTAESRLRDGGTAGRLLLLRQPLCDIVAVVAGEEVSVQPCRMSTVNDVFAKLRVGRM